ncbi:hypothetical protein [Parvularcula marina]|uniref:hypothetical protein n=1 Tax=Parvularcula marina TaxID=2292771 RepID=UPI0035122FBF
MRLFIRRLAGGLAVSCGSAALAASAMTQDFRLNGERLSSFEEPLAAQFGDITFSLNGLIDGALDADLNDSRKDDLDGRLTTNFEMSAVTQLPIRWNVGLAYFGQYETIFDEDSYTDNIAGFISGSWGTIVGGEVADIVKEETRRLRGAGNARLAFDGPLGGLDDWGGGYVGQFGPSRMSTIIDEHGDVDFGWVWARPVGVAGYRYGLRYTNGDFRADDGVTVFETDAVTGTFEHSYGRRNISIGLGTERLEALGVEAERWYSSAGWQYQFGNIVLSAEGHYGEIEGEEEASGALGAQYFLARGLSANLGINYNEAVVTLETIPLLNRDELQALLSLRYGY